MTSSAPMITTEVVAPDIIVPDITCSYIIKPHFSFPNDLSRYVWGLCLRLYGLDRILIGHVRNPTYFYYTSLIIHKLLNKIDRRWLTNTGVSILNPDSKKNVILDIINTSTFLRLECNTGRSTKTVLIEVKYEKSLRDTPNHAIFYTLYYDRSDNQLNDLLQSLYWEVGASLDYVLFKKKN